jgi:hypothetical protein
MRTVSWKEMTLTNDIADVNGNSPTPPSTGRVNLVIFEGLMGAVRRRLPHGRCGLTHAGRDYPCFEGHDRYDNEGL